ncbi:MULTISPECIES: hypothetical protein [Aquimarina]|uniref:Uncharacterized protein n=1 Tax=Aquimarina aggregata TaxID=1642818 RepID=A0A162YK93_9FLAO|nr:MULTISPECIES: hypothetical protein [Aquimarina]KZS39190.1 hypothetical protein AWE51_11590 [Aquimarina aggregata]
METLETAPVMLKTSQDINLIDGVFTATEAADIINSVLKVKINFHKLQRLSRTEGDFTDSCEYDNGRIDELISEQEIAKEFFGQARLEGKKLKMKSTIEIFIED